MKTVSDVKVPIPRVRRNLGMLEMYAKPDIKKFTTNATLMRKAGVSDYESFAREILQRDSSLSWVFVDDVDEMARQARKITTRLPIRFEKAACNGPKG